VVVVLPVKRVHLSGRHLGVGHGGSMTMVGGGRLRVDPGLGLLTGQHVKLFEFGRVLNESGD
jgi:hypothetical protein